MGSKMITELKVGDKVRVIKFPNKSYIGKICEVIDIERGGSSFCCRVKEKATHWNCLMFANEIEKIPPLKKGQQLLLFEL